MLGDMLYGMMDRIQDARHYGFRAAIPQEKRLEALAQARNFNEPFGRFLRIASKNIALDERQQRMTARLLESRRPKVYRNRQHLVLEYSVDINASPQPPMIPGGASTDFSLLSATGSLVWSFEHGPASYRFARSNCVWPAPVRFLFLDTVPSSAEEFRMLSRACLPEGAEVSVRSGAITIADPRYGTTVYNYLGTLHGDVVFAYNARRK